MMNATYHCAIPNCPSAYRRGAKNKHFFRLSKVNFEAWTAEMEKYQLLPAKKHAVICEDHFEMRHFRTAEKKKLNRNAVPTLFPTVPVSVMIHDHDYLHLHKMSINDRMRQLQANRVIQADHCYAVGHAAGDVLEELEEGNQSIDCISNEDNDEIQSCVNREAQEANNTELQCDKNKIERTKMGMDLATFRRTKLGVLKAFFLTLALKRLQTNNRKTEKITLKRKNKGVRK